MSAIQDEIANLKNILNVTIDAANAKASDVSAAVAGLNQKIADLEATVAANGEVTVEDIRSVGVLVTQLAESINAIPPLVA